MKVLQINCVYKSGSTGSIMWGIHNVLKSEGVQSVMCYGRGAKVNTSDAVKVSSEIYSKFNNVFSRLTGVRYGGCFFSTLQLKHIIKKNAPDIVHLQCINGHFVNIYKIVNWLKKNNYKTVLTLHAEFMYTANCSSSMGCFQWETGCCNCPHLKRATRTFLFDRTKYSFNRMKKAFEGFGNRLTVVAVSDWLKERARRSLILRDANIVTVLNGINTEDVFKFTDNTEDVYRDIRKNGEKIILHVTSDFTNVVKGSRYLIELAKRFGDGVKFVLVGNTDKNIDLPENIIDIGRVNGAKELAKYYMHADATVITSRQETYSMVTAESLSSGTPVFGFEAGGPESIAIPRYSHFVKQGDVDALELALKKYLFEAEPYDKRMLSSEACGKYSSSRMGKEYLNVYRDIKNS